MGNPYGNPWESYEKSHENPKNHLLYCPFSEKSLLRIALLVEDNIKAIKITKINKSLKTRSITP